MIVAIEHLEQESTMHQAREENGDLFGYGDGHELLTQHLDQLELPDDPEYSGVMQSMLQVFKTVVNSHKGEADTLPMALLLKSCGQISCKWSITLRRRCSTTNLPSPSKLACD